MALQARDMEAGVYPVIMRYVLSNEVGQQAAQGYLSRLIEKGATVDIIQKREPRTKSQNAYMWKLMTLLGIELGYTKDEMAIEAKRHLRFWYEKNGSRFLRSTADLDVLEMSEWIEKVRTWAAALGYPLPSADQYWENQAEYDDYIDQNARAVDHEKP